MKIEIIKQDTTQLRNKIKSIYQDLKKRSDKGLNPASLDIIKNILSDKEIKEMFKCLNDSDFIANMSYKGLAQIEEAARVLSENITRIKRQVELDDFLSKGYNLDIEELKRKYKEKNLKEKHPNLDFKRIKELYIRPPKKLTTYYDTKMKIHIDDFVFRKYLLGVLQMIFNHMDMVICNIGDEGAGKSCKCSQDMYMLWWLMKEIGLIDYKYNINEMFANTLRKFAELEDKYYGKPFRIIGLDEGNELNKQDWKEDDVKLFQQRLRRERHEQRIKFINIPVLGEMIINIVLSRINFIFNMLNKNETKTGTLYKGHYDFYIIPRGDRIYSPYMNRELTKQDIKNKLYMNLKDKSYLKGLPREIKIKRCYCNGVWGFKEKDYVKQMKETNRAYTVGRGIRFGFAELYCFYKAKIKPKDLGISTDDAIYPSLKKMIYKIRAFWVNDPEQLKKYDMLFEEKQKEKAEKQEAKNERKERDKATSMVAIKYNA